MGLANGGEHSTDLRDQRVSVRSQRERVLELLVEVRDPPRDRAAPGREA